MMTVFLDKSPVRTADVPPAVKSAAFQICNISNLEIKCTELSRKKFLELEMVPFDLLSQNV